MLQYIIELDEQLLLLCNGVHTPWLDNFFWIVTSRSLNIFVALPLLLILGWYIHNNPHKKKALFDAMLVVVALAIAVLIADQVASSVFKPLFQRLRPSRDPDLSVILVNGYRGGRYGFVSSHAANTFAAALFLINIFRNRFFTLAILLWAVLVSYSRLYLGVHFPGDILCGALLGILVGILVYRLYERVRGAMFRRLQPTSVPDSICMRGSYACYYALYIVLMFGVVAVVAL